MDLAQRLSHLESNRDWQGLVEELERGLATETDPSVKANLYLRLGRVLSQQFLQGAKALKHFQEAYKQSSQLIVALEDAREIYWLLGKLNMVQKLLDLELKSAGDGPLAPGLFLEQGDVLCDAGDYEQAAARYARAMQASGGSLPEAAECLQDAQADESGAGERLALVKQLAAAETNAATRSRYFVRAARLARRAAPTEVESLLAEAYRADPTSKQAAALYEGLLVEAQRADDIAATQEQVLSTLSGEAKADAAFRFGARWASRHQNVERAAKFLETSMNAAPSEAAFTFLREQIGTREGNWERVAALAESAAQRVTGPSAVFFLAQAGQILWKQVGNLIRARAAFAALANTTPDHPMIQAFEAQIGEPVGAATPGVSVSVVPGHAARSVVPTEAPEGSEVEVDTASAAAAPTPVPPASEAPAAPVVSAQTPDAETPASVAPEAAPTPVPASVAPAASEAPAPASVAPAADAGSVAPEAGSVAPAAGSVAPPASEPAAAATASAPPKPAVDEAQIASLREQAAKQEAAKRLNEYVKTIVTLATIVPDDFEKIDLLTKAADLYVNKFANQTEAVKVYELLLEIETDNSQAIEYLRGAYEKRRDWEKLIGLQRKELESTPPGSARTQKYIEMAKLASEKLRAKPELSIELWQAVLNDEPENVEALSNLAGLYERAKEFTAWATILEKQVEVTYDAKEKIALLNKLGTLYGDRLSNDAGAVEAFRQLLTLDPNDKRAQEALKKKYLALGRWDDLEVFYAESGKWDEFIRVLETQEAKEADPAAKIGLLMKIAQLWADKKQKVDRAAKSYEKVLELDPKHLAAAEALVPIYQQTKNDKGLAFANEVKLLHEEVPELRLDLLRDLTGIYERLKDLANAFERTLQAFDIAPGEARSLEDIERLAKATTRWDELVAAFRKAIARAGEEGDREGTVALRLGLGRILVDEVGRVDDAIAEYRAVYDDDGENMDAISALERLYRQTSRFAELLSIFEKKRDLAIDPDEKRTTLYSIARLYENELKDLDRAIETYRIVLEDEPTDAVALKALDDLYGRLEQWPLYVEILQKRIEQSGDDAELIDQKFRLGQTLDKHLNDPAGALENYREILFVDQAHEGARLALEALLANESLASQAASILEPIYELRSDWESLVRSLDILASTEQDQAQRVGLLRKMGRTLAGSIGDVVRAFDASARALLDDPSNLETRAELEGYAEQANAWEKLDGVLHKIADGLTDPALARDYFLRMAQIDERLNRVDAAAERYTRVLGLDPADADALGALDALYRRTERWTDLIGVFRRRIDLAQDSEARESLYSHMAQVYEEKLAQPEQAIAAYREVLSGDEASQVALTALDALFTRQAMWPELADNLEAQLRLADSEEAQLLLMLRLADLRETRMSQVDQAIEIYRQVLEREPSNVTALEALERLGKLELHEVQIAEILEPLYRTAADYVKLIGVHEVQVRRSEDPERKVDLLTQIATLHEEGLSNLVAAFDTLARALAVDPSHEGTQNGLDRLARMTSRFQDLAGVFETLAAKQTETALACTLFAKSARVYENDLGNVDAAIGHYRRVLELDPSNLDATESLERLFRQVERYADLSLILQHKSQIVDDVTERKDALYQAAVIEQDVLEQKEASIAVYQKVLDIDPEDLRAIDSLVGLFLNLARWEELLGIYQKKVDLILDPDEKKAIHYQQGAVFERELGDVSRAIGVYQQVLEIDPDDLTALGRLDVLYQAARNWPELLVILQHEAELTGDAEEAISFQYRIAELYEKHLADVPRAVELYRDILGQLPDHVPTLQALEGLKTSSADPLPAALVLEPVYEASGDWKMLISALEVQVRYAEEPFRKVELLHRIARLHEDSLEDASSAFETYARALPVDNTNDDTLTALERIASTIGRWPAVAQLYDAELDRLADNVDRFIELGLRVAQIYETQLEDVDSAIARYRRVLTVDAENQAAVRSLDRLFTQTERWAELGQILAREAEIGQNPDEILEFKHRLGQLHQTKLSDVPSAIAAYRDILNAAPEHNEALEALEGLFAAGTKQLEIAEIIEPLYEATNEWEKLRGVYEAKLAHLTVPDERLAMFYRLAELNEEKIGDGLAALEVFVRALKEQPLDERGGLDAERLAAAVDGGWEKLANAYADITNENTDATVRTTIGKRLARVFEEELQEIENAEKTYQYVLSVEPLEGDALANLDRIYTAQEQYTELAETLEKRVKAVTDRIELVDLYARLGEVYEVKLQKVDDAIRAYRKIFDELDRIHEGSIAALGRLYEQKQSWRELHGVHERELEIAAGDSAEADIRAKIAYLQSDRLGEVPKAIETWKRVLDLRGEDGEALEALGKLYEREEQWAELTEILERQADFHNEEDVKVAALVKRAQTFSTRLGRDEHALENWSRVLDIDYANVDALRAVAEIRRKQGDPNELVASLHQTVDRASAVLDADELKAIFRELGKTYGQILEQPFDAADAWTRLLEVDPSDFEALAALEAIYRSEERWEDVIKVRMMRAEALTETDEKINEYFAIAAHWREQLGDRDGGRIALEKVIEVDAANDAAFIELEYLHGEAERWEPLIELYLGRLDTRESVAEKNDLLRRIAKVFDEKLGDKNQAFDALLNGFAEDFSDNETVKYLEKMAQATSRWAELLQASNGWLQEQTDARQRIVISLRLAKWYGEDLGKPDYAQPYFQEVMKLDPSNVGARRQMANLLRKNQQWQQVGSALTQALQVAVTDTDRKEINTELGDLLMTQMQQVDQALPFYLKALDIDPHFVPAIESLEKIYTDRGQTEDLVKMLKQKVPGLTEPEQIASTKLRTASLLEAPLSQLEESAQLYREVLEIDASSLPAMRGLERVYGSLKRWAELVQILEAQLDVVPTERERIDALYKIAQVQEDQFLKPDLAAQRLEQVLEIDPNHELALEALERCYRKMRQWLDLIQTYERHVTATNDQQKRIELYGLIALVYADEVEDVDRAIDAYRNITDIDDNNIGALEALSKLYEKQGDARQAIDYMTMVAERTVDGKQKVDMYFRIGKALDEKLSDRVQAQDKYEIALDLDPTHVPTLGALRAIAMDMADWDRAARYLDQEQLNTNAPRQRAKLLVELGKLREEMLGEHDLAVQAFELALQSDADSEDAALPLMQEYMRMMRWQDAEPLAELLARRSSKRERSEQQMLHKSLAKISAELGKDDKALKSYQAALLLDMTDQETIRGLADVQFRAKDWPGALSNYQKVLTALGEEEVDERANIYFRLGQIKREQGQGKQAINNYEKAIALSPGHRESLEALVAVYADAKDWKQVIEYKRQILDNIYDGDERYALLGQIGDIWADNEKNPGKAIEAFEEARDLKPDDHRLLTKMLPLYEQTQAWQQMVDTLQSLADADTNIERKAKYLFTMGQYYRDKIQDLDQAVEMFDRALDIQPLFVQAFERIERIYTAAKDWKALERATRKMLLRIKDKNTELEFKLAHGLGLIYRDRQKDFNLAIQAFQIALEKKPDELVEHQILAELYELVGDQPSAIAQQQALLTKDPTRVDPYRSLYKLYQSQHEFDPAWCMSAALTFLRKADAEEKGFFDQYRPQGMLPVKSRLDNVAWVKYLFHDDASLVIGKIFEMLVGPALQAKVEQLKGQNKLPALDPRYLRNPATATETFAKTFGWAGQVLGITTMPQLYLRPDAPGSLMSSIGSPPAAIAGQSVLSGFTPQELTFICGKFLAQYRNEFLIRTIFPTQIELEVILLAGIKIAKNDFALPPDKQAQVMPVAQLLAGKMQPVLLQGLQQAVKHFFDNGAKINLKRWLQGAEATSARAGLILCGDLEIARKILSSEPQQPGDLSAAEKMKDLLSFSVSENYFAIRKALGIAVGG